MSPFFWLDLAAYSISTVIATALALMVLGAGPRRTLNRLFALFILAEAAWAISCLLLRMALWLRTGNPVLLLELTAMTFALMGPLLLLFTVRYVSAPTAAVSHVRWANLAAVLGLATMAILSVPLFRHQIIFNPRLHVSGVTVHDVSTLGFVLASLPTLYMLWSLALFWQERRRTGEPYLAVSVLVLLAGFAVGGLFNPPFPVMSITTTFSIAILGHRIVGRQLFNPLRELTEELEQRVEERTQKLAQAAAQLTAIQTLGQKLVLSRNATEIARLVVDAAQQVLHVPICSVWMVDKKQKEIVRWAHTSGPEDLEIPPLPLDGEQGIITFTIRSGRPIYLPDVSQDPRYMGGEFQSRSELCVPLKVSDQVIGALNAESEKLDAFSPADRQLLDALANSAAITIHNAQLHEETRRRTERLAAVNRIANAAGTTLYPQDLVEIVYREIASVFQPDAFFVALYDEETNELDLPFAIDAGVKKAPGRFPLSGLTSLVVTEKKALVIRDLDQEQDYPQLAVLVGDGKHTASWMGAPLLVGERVIGVISVQAYRPYVWDKDDELLLLTIADQVAVALEKANLFQGRERRITELAIVNEIGQAVSSALEMDDLLETVYQQVSRLFDTTNFHIATYEEESHEWTVVYHIEYGQPQPTAKKQLFGKTQNPALAVSRKMKDAVGVLGTGLRHEVEAGLSGYVIRNRQHLVLQSSEEILAFEKAQGIESVGDIARSWLGVPLIAADKIVGMMGIQSYERENLYSEQDLALFSTVATQVAPGLDNLRMLEETRHRAWEIEVINEVGRAITSVLDLDTVLRQIVDISKARFGHYFVGILLLEGDQLVSQSGSTVGDSDARPEFDQSNIDLTQRGPSLLAEAARTGQPVLSNDTLTDPRYLAEEEFPDTRCELCLPIRAKGRVIGVLDVQSDRPFAYSQTDVAILQSLADQAGVAIENARLFEQVRTHAIERATLNKLGQALTARLDVEEVLDEAYRQTSRLLDTTNFYVGLYDPRKDEIAFLLDTVESEIEREITTIPASQGVNGYIVRNRTSVLIQENALERLTEMGVELIGELSLSWLGVPLIVGDRVLGVMGVQSFTTPHAYDEHDRDLLTAIASSTAIALQNAYLFEKAETALAETENLAQELAVLNELAQALTARLDVEEVLDEAYRGASRLLDATNFTIGLYDPDEEEITFPFTTNESKIDRQIAVMPVSQGINGYIVRNRTSVLIEENTLERLEEMGMEPVGETALSFLGVPLIVGDRVLGAMTVQSFTTPRAYDEHDRDLLMAIASQTAIATQNAQLYERARHEITERKLAEEKAQRRAAQAALIYKVGQRVSSKLELKALLSEIVTAVRDAFDYYGVLLMLLDEKTERLTLQSIAGGHSDIFPEDAWMAVEEGMTGYVAATGETQISGDVSQNPHFVRKAAEETKSELVVPIKSGQKVIGVLDLQSDELDAFDENDVMLMETLANQLAVAIENARLYEETKRYLDELSTLYEIGKEITSTLDWDVVLRSIFTQAVRATGAERSMIWLVDAANQKVTKAVGHGYEREYLESLTFQEFWDGLAGWVYREKEPVLTADALKDERAGELAGAKSGQLDTRSVALAPLLTKGEATGILLVANSAGGAVFDQSDLDLITMLAGQAAIAIENARLYEQAQHEIAERRQAEATLKRRNRELTTLYEASTAISSDLSLNTVLQTVAKQMTRALDLSGCTLSLWNREGNLVETLVDYSTVDPDNIDPTGTTYDLADYPTTRRVLETGQPVVIQRDNPTADESELALVKQWKAFTVLMFPLVARDRVAGLVELFDEVKARDYTPEDIRLAQSLAAQAAIAIENARLYEETQQRLQEQTMLFNASQRLASAPLRIEEIAEIAARQLVGMMEVTELECSFSLFDPQEGTFRILADFWIKDRVEQWVDAEESFRLSDYPATARAMETLQPLVVQASDPDADPAELAYMRENDEAATLVIVPLAVKGQAIGVMEFETWEEHHYTPEQLNTVTTLANQAAAALENARLYEAVQQELTERKRAEEQLRHYAAEMERANEEVKRFAYIVSHDLRAPLVNMKGFASELRLALDEIQSVTSAVLPHLDEQQKQTITYALHEDAPEALKFIDSSVTRMDHFISALLVLSRLGRRELKPEPVDVGAIVQSTLPTMAHQIAERQVKVTVGALPEVVADRTSMEQIIGNILGNAVKYLTEDRPGEIEITAKRSDGETIFRIQDNGRGIAEDNMDKVFAPFRRAGRQDVPGEGMGLAYVQALIRRHGGRIWCESELGVGTAFTFTISNHLKEGGDDA